MTNKLSLTLKEIKALDVDTLARLISREVRGNKGFKNAVIAARIAKGGDMDDLVRVINQQMDDLHRSKVVVSADKIIVFRRQLRQLVNVIYNELEPLSMTKAVYCLLRFIKTHESVCQRVDDVNGTIDQFYFDVFEKLETMTNKFSPEELDGLPKNITQMLLNSSFDYFEQAMHIICPKMSTTTLEQWDQELQQLKQSKAQRTTGRGIIAAILKQRDSERLIENNSIV